MKHLITFLLFTFCLLSCPINIMAQSDDDSRYLEGAVLEEDGRIVFKKEFNIPGMTQDQVYQRMLTWLEQRLKENDNATSRVVYNNEEEGLIAGLGEEWIVFKSSALSLDRTWVNYQVSITCKPEHCIIELSKIRFAYREKEKYTAEELITDKYALNKSKTKLISGLAKWRRKTVDFADDMFDSAAKALSAANPSAQVKEETIKPAVSTNSPVIIHQEQPVVVAVPQPVVSPTAPAPSAPVVSAGELKEVSPADVPKDAIKMSEGKLVIVIGSDAFNMTMMTANVGGSIGKVDGKPVVFSILSPDQPYEALEKATSYTVKFFPTGQTDPSMVLECSSLPSPAVYEGQPRTFVGEIVKAWIKE